MSAARSRMLISGAKLVGEDFSNRKEKWWVVAGSRLDHTRRGQQQLLLSAHDFTSKDGTKERAWARLAEVVRTILTHRHSGEKNPEGESEGSKTLRVTRRAVRGHDCVYFRAPDADTAMPTIGYPGGPLTPDTGQAFDGVDARGIEPFLALGELVALAQNTRWHPEHVPFVLLWPPAEDEPSSLEEYEDMPEDSPWKTSPATLQELGVSVRESLASIPDHELPGLATRWAHGENLSQYSDSTPNTILPLVTNLVALARRARDTNQMLYVWSRRYLG
ncbi:hypothetical protein [Actinophytocola xinjiangensis]|uniref:hypothetical protein n=1 Tax=Actinophytocola xinjiangensis TaxID=485602 RepID=UPI000B18F47D|nr:hypothetical protein [Actinophytocola xinjiangensis]